MLVLSLLCGVLCCVAMIRGGVAVLSRAESGRRSGWIQLLFAPGLGVASVALYDSSPQVYESSVLADIGLALMLAAVVLAAWIVVEGKGRVVGLRVLRGVAVGLAVFLVGYGLTVWTAVRRHGWWAGMPTNGLVLLTPWLPEKAIWQGNWHAANGSLYTRLDSIAPNGWQARYLRKSLEKRYRDSLSESDRELVLAICQGSTVIHELEKEHLCRLVQVFCETADHRERSAAAGALYDHCPFHFKVSRSGIGAKYGSNAFEGKLARVMELTRDEDRGVRSAAIDAVGYFGDAAADVVPTLVHSAAIEIRESDWYWERNVLEYLAKTSDKVREQIRSLARDADVLERLVAYEALAESGSDPTAHRSMIRVMSEADDETALAAFKTFWFWRDQNGGIDAFVHQTRQHRANREQFVSLVAESVVPIPYLLDTLGGFLNDPSPAMRTAACRTVEQLALRSNSPFRSAYPDNAIADAVRKLQSEPDTEVRTAADNAWRALRPLSTP